MKISEQALKLLALTEFRPHEPLEELLSHAQVRISSARYHQRRLIEHEVIRGSVAYIDTNRLGLTSYGIYFSLATDNEKSQRQLLKKLSTTPRVSWVAALGGQFQYVVNIRTYHVSELVEVMHDISSVFPNLVMSKSVAVRVSLHLFSRRIIKNRPRDEIRISTKPRSVELDDVDEDVLDALSRVNHLSLRQRALQAGIPPATFFRRKEALEEKKVIAGYAYEVDSFRLGLQPFRILVSFHSIVAQHHEALYSFARKTPEVRKLVECVGAWDCELEIEVEDNRQAAEFRNKLYGAFEQQIESINIIPLFGHLHYRSYL